MLSVAEARQRLLDALPVCGTETAHLGTVLGRVLAEDILADAGSPSFDNSGMDGFAVKAADTRGASAEKPRWLDVVGDIPAGKASDTALKAGQAMRIMTGAPVPAGADAVVPVEDTDVYPMQPGAPLHTRIQVMRAAEPGASIRPAGEDFRAGEVLLRAGVRIRAQEAALLAMVGKVEVSVYKKSRVAILSSGDELLNPGEPLQPGKIRETNSISLGALIESCGAEFVPLGIAKDNLEDVVAHLERGVASGANLILSSAGVSVGAYDYLREALTGNGGLHFWKVNMRPGKPFTFGDYRSIPYVGLPGNPVSSFVGFEVFLRPALNKMGGVRSWSRLTLPATLMDDASSDGRETYFRCYLESGEKGLTARLTGHQGSGNLYSLVQANALLRVPAGAKEVSRGSQVEVWPLVLEA